MIGIFLGCNSRDMFSDGNCDSSLGSLAGLLSGSVGVEELPVLVMPVDSFGFKLREPSFLHNNIA